MTCNKILAFALLALLPAQAGDVKNVAAMKILAVEWKKTENIARSFADLVNYYNNGNLRDIAAMQIVFPQTSFVYPNGRHFIGVAFQGRAAESGNVRIRKIAAGKFHSTLHVGPYQKLDASIDAAYDSLFRDGYVPDKNKPMQLRYWNSPDDNPPQALKTEILIPLK